MNSIRSFVEHLGEGMEVLALRLFADMGLLDSKLLEGNSVWHDQFPVFPFCKEDTIFAWVILWKGKPYFISGFDVKSGNGGRSVVYVLLREIKVGQVAPAALSTAELQLAIQLSIHGEYMKLANCSARTFKWIKCRPVTNKILARISRAA